MHTVSTWDRFIGAVALFIGVMLTLIAPFLTVVLLFTAIPFQAIGAALSSIGDTLNAFPSNFRDCINCTTHIANKGIHRMRFGKEKQNDPA